MYGIEYILLMESEETVRILHNGATIASVYEHGGLRGVALEDGGDSEATHGADEGGRPTHWKAILSACHRGKS